MAVFNSNEPPALFLDATLWDAPTTGIGLYTRELHSAMGRRGAKVVRLGAEHSGEVPRHTRSRTLYTLGELPRVLRAERRGVFHAVANFNLPLVRPAGHALVLTVHDVIPLLLRDTVSYAYHWQFRLWLARSLQLADGVVCVSDTTRQDVLRLFPDTEPKLRVVHNGVDHVRRWEVSDAATERALEALALPERFVLYAGALDARKNVEVVLEAVRRLHAAGRKIPLVLVGQRWFGSGPVERAVERLVGEGVALRHLGYQPEPVFYALMRQASAFVFPSRYEGFGLPPLEAMWLGVPTVVARAGALPEVCGEGAAYVSPDDAEGLAQVLAELVESPAARRALGEAGRARAHTFIWDDTARRTLGAYEEAYASRAAGEKGAHAPLR